MLAAGKFAACHDHSRTLIMVVRTCSSQDWPSSNINNCTSNRHNPGQTRVRSLSWTRDVVCRKTFAAVRKTRVIAVSGARSNVDRSYSLPSRILPMPSDPLPLRII
jgi:hypothetical protein